MANFAVFYHKAKTNTIQWFSNMFRIKSRFGTMASQSSITRCLSPPRSSVILLHSVPQCSHQGPFCTSRKLIPTSEQGTCYFLCLGTSPSPPTLTPSL